MGYLTNDEAISIHALLAESDTVFTLTANILKSFLSTLSLRRATYMAFAKRSGKAISIHALLAESDSLTPYQSALITIFLSTLSLRRATRSDEQGPSILHYFYPRSPCGERLLTLSLPLVTTYFYPRSPCGERRGRARPRWLQV